MSYVATINTPGYLPMDDDPPIFDTAREAWEYLAEERNRAEFDAPSTDSPSEAYEVLRWRGTRDDAGEGTVYGDTPGYDGTHDLGLAYSVTFVEGECEGHPDGPVMGETFYCDGSCN